MKKKLFLISWLPVLLLTTACNPSPEPIEYGEDVCHYCKMTIVDQQHGAEAVTEKGKVFKFDAIECMVNYLGDKHEEEYAFLLINDYMNPGELIDARTAVFLKSKSIPSPMGAFLSGFNNKETLNKIKASNDGQVLEWGDLKSHLSEKISDYSQ